MVLYIKKESEKKTGTKRGKKNRLIGKFERNRKKNKYIYKKKRYKNGTRD